MYREKLINTRARTDNARRLKDLLIAYHDFRQVRDSGTEGDRLAALCQWQAERLKTTHADLYEDSRYRAGLDFLLEDLYAPQTLTRRDDDIDRVFPVMVKLLPDALLATVAELVELNLLTQRLDSQLAHTLFHTQQCRHIDAHTYAEAYRQSAEKEERLRQIQLVANIGDDLDRYVGSRTISFALSITEGAAEMAGLGDLHRFLRRGFSAFRAMNGVDELLTRIVARETEVMEGLFRGDADVIDRRLPPVSLATSAMDY